MKTTRRVSPVTPSTDTCTETEKTPTQTIPEVSATGFASVRSSGIRVVGTWSNDAAGRGQIRA